jgi:hypothetical protein
MMRVVPLIRLMRRVAAGCAVCVLAAACSPAIDPAAIADAQTAARVKTALVNDPDLGGRAIEVRVTRGVATLSGRVLTQGEADRASALAGAVPGVSEVRTNLLVGVEPPASAEEESSGAPTLLEEPEFQEFQSNPRLLAVGAALRLSDPHAGGLKERLSISPLIKLGSGEGLGPAIAFGWFSANLQSMTDRPEVVSRVYVKPVMVGASYTLASERVSVSPSLVGGVAFNSVSVTELGPAAGVPVEVDNSLAWRPGVSVWVDLGRRLALNLSAGYLMTRLRITMLQDGRLEKRDAQGDTTLVHAGLVYKVF